MPHEDELGVGARLARMDEPEDHVIIVEEVGLVRGDEPRFVDGRDAVLGGAAGGDRFHETLQTRRFDVAGKRC